MPVRPRILSPFFSGQQLFSRFSRSFSMQIWAGLADLFWPPRCAACDLYTEDVFCTVCSDTLLATTEPQKLSFLRPAAWDFAMCRYEFGGQLAVAIRRAKYAESGAAL